jgi:hypothetical protein
VTGAVELHKQVMKPTRLCYAAGHGAILRLSARTRDDVLTLRGPGYEVATQEHRVARSGHLVAAEEIDSTCFHLKGGNQIFRRIKINKSDSVCLLFSDETVWT